MLGWYPGVRSSPPQTLGPDLPICSRQRPLYCSKWPRLVLTGQTWAQTGPKRPEMIQTSACGLYPAGSLENGFRPVGSRLVWKMTTDMPSCCPHRLLHRLCLSSNPSRNPLRAHGMHRHPRNVCYFCGGRGHWEKPCLRLATQAPLAPSFDPCFDWGTRLPTARPSSANGTAILFTIFLHSLTITITPSPS